jgi:hypothetical protein
VINHNVNINNLINFKINFYFYFYFFLKKLIKLFFYKKERKTIMVFTAYNCEQIYMKRIMVAGGGMGNGNAYAVVEILYNDEQMEEVDSVWYKEFGDNPINKRIGNEVEWCEYDTFKILEDGEYVEEEDKEEEEEEDDED